MAELQKVFRENLRRRLSEKKLSQRDFAHMLGVSEAYVSQLLNGDHAPTLETVEKISRALRANNLSLLTASEIEVPAEISAISS